MEFKVGTRVYQQDGRDKAMVGDHFFFVVFFAPITGMGFLSTDIHTCTVTYIHV